MLTKFLVKITPAIALALFCFGLVAARDVMRNAPAFNEDLLSTAITGDTRLSLTADMYDQARYEMQIGFGYVNSIMFSFDGIESQNETPTAATLTNRFELAREHLLRSITLNPANGNAWHYYAQAVAAVGTPQETADAIRTAQSLNPNSARLARERIFMIASLRENAEDPSLLDDVLTADVALIENVRPRLLADLPI